MSTAVLSTRMGLRFPILRGSGKRGVRARGILNDEVCSIYTRKIDRGTASIHRREANVNSNDLYLMSRCEERKSMAVLVGG